MNLSNLHLERVKLPADAEERAKNEVSVSKKGEYHHRTPVEGIYFFVWDTTEQQNYWTELVGDTSKDFKYVLVLNTYSKKMQTLAVKLAKEQKSTKRPALALLDVILEKMGALGKNTPGYDDFDFWPLITGEWIFLWACNGESKNRFVQLCAEFSTVMRELAKGDMEKLAKDIFKALLKDQSPQNIKKVAKKMLKNAEELQGFEGSSEYLNQLSASTVDILPLLPVLGTFVDSKTLGCWAQAQHLPEQLAADDELKRNLFYAIQATFEEYSYSFDGPPTKERMEDLVVRVGGTLAAYGYEIHPNGVVTLIRLFTNDVEEGLDYDEYLKNEPFDAAEFAYTDTSESFYDSLWSAIDVAQLLRNLA